MATKTQTGEAIFSLDVLRAILAELDLVDDRLGDLDASVVDHLEQRGCERRDLSKRARDAWSKLEDIDAAVLELKMGIREFLEEAGLEVAPAEEA